MIYAGKTSDIEWEFGIWLILDIGFSNKARSCGLLIGNSDPVEIMFSEVVDRVIEASREYDSLNLVIEAPLSVAFDKHGNPKGKSLEKQDKRTRYWCSGLGCVVLTAATYLMRALVDSNPHGTIRLFEGFVSYKTRRGKTNHSHDVLLLQEVIKDPVRFSSCIFDPTTFLVDPTDVMISAFKVAGMDFGIPPIIRRDG